MSKFSLYLVWCAKVWISFEKQQFKRLAVFLSILEADTKIVPGYNFVAPLKEHRRKFIDG